LIKLENSTNKAEVTKLSGKIFKQIDAEASGKISRSQLRRFLTSSVEQPTKELQDTVAK